MKRSLQFLKNAFWLQDLAIALKSRVHPAIGHGLSKVTALKNALYFAELDGLEGDYLEFGVFQGSSMISAYKCWKNVRRGRDTPRAFYGFDSFEGVKIHIEEDQHPIWVDGAFAVDFERVKKRIAKHLRDAKWNLVKGYLEDTVEGKGLGDFGIEKVAVVLIDVDLGGPTKIALDFVKPGLQEGSIVIFDDYLFYSGNLSLGEQGAFRAFQEENDNFTFTRLYDYGLCGRAFIVSEIRSVGQVEAGEGVGARRAVEED